MKKEEDKALLLGNMRSMISLIDKLRDFNLNDYISLPRIAVLGEQSAGKSSLLESICGLTFLPRGSGIVTRRPLELRMIRRGVPKPYFEFPKDYPSRKFENPEEVTKIIEELTDKNTDGIKGISKNPIVCTVFSPTVPDLTLIDLPGITRNPVGGQPENIEEITKDLVRHYCKNEDTLILCVIPANIDLSNSDALKFSRQLDPRGERTIGVLTKIDLMDEGTDARSILLNEEIKLRYGYVGIKGRSQADIKRSCGVQEAIQKELDFFGKHPIYSTLPIELLGTRSLINRVSSLLFKMIEKSLPRIKKEIFERKKRAKSSLEQLGNEFPELEEHKMELVFMLVRQFKENFNQEINGKYFHRKIDKKSHRSSKRETITFQLNSLFKDLYKEFSDKDYEITSDYTDDFIQNAIDVYQGNSIPGFHSFDSFLFLVHPKIDKLKEPIYALLDDSKNILEERGLQIMDLVFKKFHVLHTEVKDTFLKQLNDSKHDIRKILNNLISCEDNYLFTNDPLFLETTVHTEKNKKIMSATQLLVRELRGKINKYFFIIVRNLRDIVPKLIGQFMVKKFNKNLEVAILNELNEKNYCLDSLCENKITFAQRKKLKLEIDSLQKAESLLINDFNMGYKIETPKARVSHKTNNHQISFDDEEDEFDLEISNLERLNDEFLDFNQNLLNNTTHQNSTMVSHRQGHGGTNMRNTNNNMRNTSNNPRMHNNQTRHHRPNTTQHNNNNQRNSNSIKSSSNRQNKNISQRSMNQQNVNKNPQQNPQQNTQQNTNQMDPRQNRNNNPNNLNINTNKYNNYPPNQQSQQNQRNSNNSRKIDFSSGFGNKNNNKQQPPKIIFNDGKSKGRWNTGRQNETKKEAPKDLFSIDLLGGGGGQKQPQKRPSKDIKKSTGNLFG